jgi:hypothetical protein
MEDRDKLKKELEDAKYKILEQIEILDSVLSEIGGTVESRARSYWYAHIRTALDKNHGYMGGSMVTMQDTIDEFEE